MSANVAEARLPYYNALRKAALAQQEALAADDLKAFQSLMKQREELLAGIERLGPMQPSGPAVDRETAAEGHRQAATLLVGIIEADRQLQRLLASRIDKTRADLSQLRVGRQTARAYRPRSGAESLFIDAEG